MDLARELGGKAEGFEEVREMEAGNSKSLEYLVVVMVAAKDKRVGEAASL